MDSPKFTGVWISASVFHTKTLSLTAKVLYGVVEALDNEGGCYASNAYLSAHLGLEERQIRNLLSDLEDAKLIVRSEDANGHRRIRTVERTAVTSTLCDGQVTRSEGGNKLPRGRQKIATGGGNKLPTYNKEDNKEDITTPTPSSDADIPWAEDKEIGPMPFSSDEFKKAWAEWIDYRKEMKKALKPKSIKMQWKQFVLWGEAGCIESISQSIRSGWQGLFPPRQNNQQMYHKKPLTAKDHETF